MRKQNSTQENQTSLNGQPQGDAAGDTRAGDHPSVVERPSAQTGADSAVRSSVEDGFSTSSPQLSDLHPNEAEDARMDPALDALLARAQAPVLRSGFADRVIQSLQPSAPSAPRAASQSATLWLSGLAAALALCAGTLLWNRSPAQTAAPQAANTDEERLVAALRSPDLSGEDLTIVANLGEVLEAELIANHPLWLDEK